ncbi:MAG: adenylate/guanylate cyclase domain-containing protein [Chitinophagaceae bacterium]
MRQLAAIMFADMSGYTAIMQENEQLAKLKRKRLKAVLETSMPLFNGNLLQYYGDGSLSIFSSAIDSVQCAIQIQQMLKEDPAVDLRIGIHTGDIAIEDGTVYGDGVNLASRIETLAVAGGIFVSEKVYDEIKNQDNIRTREMGYFEIKNVKNAVRVFAIANDGITVPARVEIKGKTKQPSNRLAVLPFVNMSADPENEYFSDGITEELLNALTKVEGLQVTSRISAFAFKGKNDDIRDIALRLNVDKVLEGSVRKAGNRVRITAQLINAADGYHIWSESYDRSLTDIFEVQDEISSIIANRLRENLTVAENTTSLVKAPVKNLDAYNLFLKGLHFYNKLTPADTQKAIQYFEEAIALEPAYSQAYAMTAAAVAYLGATGQKETHKAFDIVHRYSDKALELDPHLAEGHIAKGSAYLFYNWQWSKGYESLQKAIELNPAATEAYRLLAFYYIITRQKQEAVTVMEKALQLDPLSPVINHYLANAYLFMERYDDALLQANKVLEMHPQMRITLELTGWCSGMMGDWLKALEIFKEVYRLTNHPLKGVTPMGYAYGRLGERNKALECIAKLEQRQVEDPDVVMDSDLAMVWWSLRDADKVFSYLDQSVNKRLGPLALIIQLPQFKELTDDPRYASLKKELGL